jgi:hypothetical protein
VSRFRTMVSSSSLLRLEGVNARISLSWSGKSILKSPSCSGSSTVTTSLAFEWAIRWGPPTPDLAQHRRRQPANDVSMVPRASRRALPLPQRYLPLRSSLRGQSWFSSFFYQRQTCLCPSTVMLLPVVVPHSPFRRCEGGISPSTA